MSHRLYVPAASLHLISVGHLCDDGMTARFNTTSCCFKTKADKTIAGGTCTGKDLYQFTGDPPRVEHANILHTAPSLKTWHHHLGHVSYQAVINMEKKGLTRGMPIDLSALLPICEHCVLGKQTKTAILKTQEGERAKAKLGIVYLDITGPEAVASAAGEKYMLNFINDFTSFSWTYMLKKKSDADTVFKVQRLEVMC